MNINYELYRIFYVVAKNSNITKAALALNISQPAISKSIKNLEDSLGGKLFIRTKRGVVLTEEGKEFYNYIETAIEYINNAENKFNDLIHLESGSIRIGISQTLTKEFLMPYLETFHSLYPNIKISINTDPTSKLIPQMRNGLVDLIILNMPRNIDNDINVIKIKNIEDIFVTGNKLSYDIIKMKEINKYPLVLLTKSSNTRNFIDDFFIKNNIVLNPIIELASYTLVTQFIKSGFGIGLVTKDFAKKELEEKSLIELKTDFKIPSRYISIATCKNNIPSFSTKKLIEIITEK